MVSSPSLHTGIILCIVPPSVAGTVEGRYRHHLTYGIFVVDTASAVQYSDSFTVVGTSFGQNLRCYAILSLVCHRTGARVGRIQIL